VVNCSLTNKWSSAVSVQAWWVADASVHDLASTHQVGPALDRATGSFTLPFDFYATVTVYATATWPDGKVTTTTTTTTTTPAEPTTWKPRDGKPALLAGTSASDDSA
jgi:hypothetical protein